LSPAKRKAIVARRDQFDHGVRRLITEGIDSGFFGVTDAKLLSFAMIGAVNWIPRWYRADGPASPELIAERFAEYLVAGLRPI
jgi:TetR/AcrR family transcriptional regulator